MIGDVLVLVQVYLFSYRTSSEHFFARLSRRRQLWSANSTDRPTHGIAVAVSVYTQSSLGLKQEGGRQAAAAKFPFQALAGSSRRRAKLAFVAIDRRTPRSLSITLSDNAFGWPTPYNRLIKATQHEVSQLYQQSNFPPKRAMSSPSCDARVVAEVGQFWTSPLSGHWRSASEQTIEDSESEGGSPVCRGATEHR